MTNCVSVSRAVTKSPAVVMSSLALVNNGKSNLYVVLRGELVVPIRETSSVLCPCNSCRSPIRLGSRFDRENVNVIRLSIPNGVRRTAIIDTGNDVIGTFSRRTARQVKQSVVRLESLCVMATVIRGGRWCRCLVTLTTRGLSRRNRVRMVLNEDNVLLSTPEANAPLPDYDGG